VSNNEASSTPSAYGPNRATPTACGSAPCGEIVSGDAAMAYPSNPSRTAARTDGPSHARGGKSARSVCTAARPRLSIITAKTNSTMMAPA